MPEELTVCGKCKWYRDDPDPEYAGKVNFAGCVRFFNPVTGEVTAAELALEYCMGKNTGHCKDFEPLPVPAP